MILLALGIVITHQYRRGREPAELEKSKAVNVSVADPTEESGGGPVQRWPLASSGTLQYVSCARTYGVAFNPLSVRFLLDFYELLHTSAV